MFFSLLIYIFVNMKGKEVLRILSICYPALSMYVKKGDIRVKPGVGCRYEYHDDDVHRVAKRLSRWRGRKSDRLGIDPAEIARAIGMDMEELRSDNLCRTIVDKRRIMSVVLTHFGWTREETGKALNRSHSNINFLLRTSYLVEDESAEAIKLIRLNYGKETTQEL